MFDGRVIRAAKVTAFKVYRDGYTRLSFAGHPDVKVLSLHCTARLTDPGYAVAIGEDVFWLPTRVFERLFTLKI